MQYSSYTVSVTNGSNVVIGSTGVAFSTNAAPGYSFKILNDNVLYTISSVTDDTHLTLTSNFMGDTDEYASYQICTGYTSNQGFTEIDRGDRDWPVYLTQGFIRKVDTLLPTINKVIETTATLGSVVVPITTAKGFTITPTGACTFTCIGTGLKGQEVTFYITTSGTTSYILTWSTGFKTTGTLSTGTVSGRCFSITFSTPDGTTWWEISRTTAM